VAVSELTVTKSSIRGDIQVEHGIAAFNVAPDTQKCHNRMLSPVNLHALNDTAVSISDREKHSVFFQRNTRVRKQYNALGNRTPAATLKQHCVTVLRELILEDRQPPVSC
jgi:hypothetical protein